MQAHYYIVSTVQWLADPNPICCVQDMSQAMHSLVCYTCRGTEFYEDRQGNFTCQRCGALSQDYFAESHEVEDAIHTRGMRTIKGKVMSWSIPVDVFLVYGALINTARRVLFAAQTATKTEVDVEPITAMECVSLYQECLRGLAQVADMAVSSTLICNLKLLCSDR